MRDGMIGYDQGGQFDQNKNWGLLQNITDIVFHDSSYTRIICLFKPTLYLS